jgi:hypothetical protein
MKKIDVYQYDEARFYLKRCLKSRMPPWPMSYGTLAARAGVNKGYLWSAMKGTKSFSRTIADKLPGNLKLGKNEALYLRLLLTLSGTDMDRALRLSIVNKFRPAKFRKK